MSSTVRTTRSEAVLFFPDIPFAEQLLEGLQQLLDVVRPRPCLDDVFAVAADDVRAHAPGARVLFQVALELLDLLDRADPHPQGRTPAGPAVAAGGLGRGRPALAVRPVAVARRAAVHRARGDRTGDHAVRNRLRSRTGRPR